MIDIICQKFQPIPLQRAPLWNISAMQILFTPCLHPRATRENQAIYTNGLAIKIKV
jgi:hypothetical protein